MEKYTNLFPLQTDINCLWSVFSPFQVLSVRPAMGEILHALQLESTGAVHQAQAVFDDSPVTIQHKGFLSMVLIDILHFHQNQ